MKKELMKLSQNKGFLSLDKLIQFNNSYYYLWMCEVQKWLRETHDIRMYVIPNMYNNINGWEYCLPGTDMWTQQANGTNYPTYEQALEQGLLEALKLLL